MNLSLSRYSEGNIRCKTSVPHIPFARRRLRQPVQTWWALLRRLLSSSQYRSSPILSVLVQRVMVV